HHRLAAQHAVLVGKGEAHQFELVLLDRPRDGCCLTRLLVGPEAVTFDKAGDGRSATRGHSAAVSARWSTPWSFAGFHPCDANNPASRRPDQCHRHMPDL